MLSQTLRWFFGVGQAAARTPMLAAEKGFAATRFGALATPLPSGAVGAAASEGAARFPRAAMAAGETRQSEHDAFAADFEARLPDDSVIAHGVRVFGTVECESGAGLRIDGVVIGNVIARNLDPDRCVTIGTHGIIVGDVWAHRVRVDGAIEGTLNAEECEITGQVSGGIHSVAPPRLQGAAARVHGPVEVLPQIEFPERHQLIQRAAQGCGERLVNQIGAMEALQTLSNVRGIERPVAPRIANHAAPSPARPAGRLQAQIREIERDLAVTSGATGADTGSHPLPMKPE